MESTLCLEQPHARANGGSASACYRLSCELGQRRHELVLEPAPLEGQLHLHRTAVTLGRLARLAQTGWAGSMPCAVQDGGGQRGVRIRGMR
eukprot:2895398-Rhodomonas_salina.3